MATGLYAPPLVDIHHQVLSVFASSWFVDSRHQMRCKSSSELNNTVIAVKVIKLVISRLLRKRSILPVFIPKIYTRGRAWALFGEIPFVVGALDWEQPASRDAKSDEKLKYVESDVIQHWIRLRPLFVASRGKWASLLELPFRKPLRYPA